MTSWLRDLYTEPTLKQSLMKGSCFYAPSRYVLFLFPSLVGWYYGSLGWNRHILPAVDDEYNDCKGIRDYTIIDKTSC